MHRGEKSCDGGTHEVIKVIADVWQAAKDDIDNLGPLATKLQDKMRVDLGLKPRGD